MIVIDASAVIETLLRSSAAVRIDGYLFDPEQTIHAPHLIDAETAHVCRRLAARADVTDERGGAMLRLLAGLPIRRHTHTGLLQRMWQLRANISAYDAAYVALAEALGATLLTRDARLARAAGSLVEVVRV